MSVIENLLEGSIDMHIHTGPDPRVERRVDALQAALQAQEIGMRAIVLKSHEYPTAPLAYAVNQIVQNIAVFGSISLNFEIGGLNIYAVDTAAKLGAKVVWMPTFSSANDMKKKNIEGGITVVDGEGKLLPVVKDILEIVKRHGMVMATGHLSASEVFALVEETKNMGVWKIVITHPLSVEVGPCLGLEEQSALAKKGAFIEHTLCLTSPLMDGLHPMKLVEAIRVIGAEHCIMSTDLGQAFNPAPAEGMRVMIATMLKCGITEEELELMVKVNPAKLLDLDYPIKQNS